jgi:hypothetical protein
LFSRLQIQHLASKEEEEEEAEIEETAVAVVVLETGIHLRRV